MTYPLGCIIRPFDERELVHRLSVDTETLDYTKPRSLGAYAPACFNQGNTGSCTGNTVAMNFEIIAAVMGLPRPEATVSRLWDYWASRSREHTFPQDAGAGLADAYDVALGGLPKDTLFPFDQHSVAETPPASIAADCANQDWLAKHQPFYTSDNGGFLAGIVAALDAQRPGGLAMAWYSDFDRVAAGGTDGVLPQTVMGQIRGYHAVSWGGYIPPAPGRVALVSFINSWGPCTSAARVQAIDPQAQAGWFFLPVTHLTNGVVLEARAALPKAQPQPQPTPQPEPQTWPTADDIAAFLKWLPFAAQQAVVDRSGDELKQLDTYIQAYAPYVHP